MRFISYKFGGQEGVATLSKTGRWLGQLLTASGHPGSIDALIAEGRPALEKAREDLLARGEPVEIGQVELLPPLHNPSKIICVGLNYRDHSAEAGYKQPDYPTLFARFVSSFVGHDQPMVRPRASQQFDYEGELAAVIGKAGRHVTQAKALEHVIGYSIFNDGSIRDFQNKTPQWTLGKNFDGTGGFGPWFVTADELPPGAKGLRIETRLNGQLVQSASTDEMVFNVATLVSTISEVLTLEPGDLLVTGTPSGIGAARKPQLWMKPGDVCEVEVERIGVLRNPIVQEEP